MSSRQQRMLYDVHILPFFKRQLTTFILSWNPIFLISSFVTLDGKKDGTNLWNITQTEWWKSFSLRCSREDQKHNCKNTALMVSVIDTKAAAHKEICYVTLCTHTATQSEEFRPPLKNRFLPTNSIHQLFHSTETNAIKKPVSICFSHLFQMQFCLQPNSLTYLSFLNPARLCRRLHMLHLGVESVLLGWVMNALTLTPLFTVKCWDARLNVTGYTSSKTKTYAESLLFLLQWALWI